MKTHRYRASPIRIDPPSGKERGRDFELQRLYRAAAAISTAGTVLALVSTDIE